MPADLATTRPWAATTCPEASSSGVGQRSVPSSGMYDYPDGPDAAEERSLLRIQARVAWFMRLLTTVDAGERPSAPPGPAIHAANHRSMADLLLSTCTFSSWGWPIRPLVAVSYFERPLIGWLLRQLRCIPVEGTEALDLAAEALRDGWSIAIMPEGRIVPEEEWAETGVGRYHPGIGRLAIDTGLPVVANGASGTERFWPRGRSLPFFRPWRRVPLVLRSEVVGVVEAERAREATDEIMAAVVRCVATSDQIAGRTT